MRFVRETIERWMSNEDEELWKTFSDLYGPLYWLSTLFPSWVPAKRVRTVGLLVAYWVTFAIHLYLLTQSILLISDDMELASLNFHYWIIFIFAIVCLFMMNKNRGMLADIHRMMATDLGRYRSRQIYTEERPLKLIAEKRRQTIMFLFLPGLVLCLAGGVLLLPYIQKINTEVKYNNGVNLNLPIAAWYPFSTERGIQHYVAIMGQLLTGFFMSTVIATLELTLFRIIQQLIFEFKVLRYSVVTVFKSAKMLYDQTYSGQEKFETSNEKFQLCIGECMKECIVHHSEISKMLSGFEQLVKWPAAMAYFCGTGVIGLSLINIQSAKESENFENVVLFSTLAMAEVLNMFILSMFGEAITTESKILRDDLYILQWHKLDVRNRKIFLNFQVGITNPVIVKAGGLVDMSMDTFSSIINTSYSFFNLLNAQG
ncbi:7tm Odorant receptor [Nesidiocoris tenuis]|uniref:Odorant receptor n=1 Tax=Nesidiocoris tenuis TaxID=355587 RepID=A0ABN7ALW9_9HEMI|nr:7tm Odorant receptor [Nesidiocoris tenuis]